MPEYIIADTSCLILFDNINELTLIYKVYGEITITPEVCKEYKKTLPAWIRVKKVKNKNIIKRFVQLVDEGEASAIALAIEHKNSILIIDDKKGRKLAASLNIHITGTLGTILKAKQKRIIREISPVLKKLARAGFRVSKEVELGVLKMAGEK